MTTATIKEAMKCPSCDGQGMIGDYIGLEMRCVGVECDRCKGTGRLSPPVSGADDGVIVNMCDEHGFTDCEVCNEDEPAPSLPEQASEAILCSCGVVIHKRSGYWVADDQTTSHTTKGELVAHTPLEEASEAGHTCTFSCLTCEACPECEGCEHVDKKVWRVPTLAIATEGEATQITAIQFIDWLTMNAEGEGPFTHKNLLRYLTDMGGPSPNPHEGERSATEEEFDDWWAEHVTELAVGPETKRYARGAWIASRKVAHAAEEGERSEPDNQIRIVDLELRAAVVLLERLRCSREFALYLAIAISDNLSKHSAKDMRERSG